MKVIIEKLVKKCGDCPFHEYGGTQWSEDIYICKKTKMEIDLDIIPKSCPFIESTLNKVLKDYE